MDVVAEADNGLSAIKLVERHKPDLILYILSSISDKNALKALGPDILNLAKVSVPPPTFMLNISVSSA
jgi:chemotaxis response regulator CheB